MKKRKVFIVREEITCVYTWCVYGDDVASARRVAAEAGEGEASCEIISRHFYPTRQIKPVKPARSAKDRS